MISDADLRRELKDPYSLCPPDHGFFGPQPDVQIAYDNAYGGWIAPFVMAGINTRVVHRSNALFANAYGTDFRYDEAMIHRDDLVMTDPAHKHDAAQADNKDEAHA